MPGIFGAFGACWRDLSVARIAPTLDPLGAAPSSWQGEHGFVAAADRNGTVASARIGDWRAWVQGEIPGSEPVPWQDVIRDLSDHGGAGLGRLHGWFAILAVHEPSGRVLVAADRRGQQPLFTYVADGTVHVSTAATAFCRLPVPPAFDAGWLHESVYFNHPVLDRTFLAGVARVPPATLLAWQPGDGGFTARPWAGPFARPARLVGGREAAELERRTFLAVTADQIRDDERTAVALTGGFDARAVLASAPRRGDLLAFTYGAPGCGDLVAAAAAAAEVGVRHLPIALDEAFVARLPELMAATVRDSDGLERVVRAELQAAYPALAAADRTVVVGGVSGDHLFRDHLRGRGNVPALISAAMMGHIQGAGDGLDEPLFARLYGNRYEEFRDHVRAGLAGLRDRHGDLGRPEGYQRYLVYENAPKHFGGEAALAANHVRFRSVYWDPRMVELSFTSERGTLGLSERLPGKDRFIEAAAQAGVIVAGPHYGGGHVKGVRAATWARGNRLIYDLEANLHRARRFAANGFRRAATPLLADWPGWLAGPARPLARELLGPGSRLRAHVDGKFLDEFSPADDVRLAGRLLTAELVLRFVEAGWPLPSDQGSRTDHGIP